MARSFSSDVSHDLIPETTFAVTPSTGTRYRIPHGVDQTPFVAEFTDIVSNTKRPGRTGNGSTRGMGNVTGSLGMRYMSTPVVDALLANALSGSFTSKVLKAGTTDSSFSVVSRFQSDQYKVFSGCMVRGFTIDAKANEGTNITFDVMGVGATTSATDNALVATDIVSTAREFSGTDIKNVLLDGLPFSFLELSFQTSLDRTQSAVLGSNVGLAFGVNGIRETTVTAKVYRESLALDTKLLASNRFSFSFEAGATGNGYRHSCASMDWTVPTDELTNGSAIINIRGRALYNTASDTDLVITQL